MMKYHVNNEQQVLECNADIRNCQFGESSHFTSEADAAAHVEAKNAAKYKTNLYSMETTGSVSPDDDSHSSSENISYDLYSAAFEKVLKSLQRNNRRLEKAGIPERFELSNVEHYKKIVKGDNPAETYEEEKVRFTLNYPSISYNGYQFQARIEEVSEGNFVAYTAPGVELNGWRPESMNCEHCHKNINRKSTYAVLDSEGNRKVVGGKCIELYTGMKPSNLWSLEYDPKSVIEDEESLDAFHSRSKVEKTDDLLALAYVITKKEGYKSKAYEHLATANRINDILYPSSFGSYDPDREWADTMLSESQEVNVDQIKKEVKDAIKNSDNDWAQNLKVLIDEEYVNARGRGTVISAMAVLHKYREKKEQKPWAKGFLGQPKDKVKDIKAKVIRTEEVEEHYGYHPTYATKLTLQTEDGHRVFWKTSSENVPEKGDNIVFDATIKDTSTYKDIDSTRILRAKWKKQEADPTE